MTTTQIPARTADRTPNHPSAGSTPTVGAASAASVTGLRIDADRLWQSLMTLAAIGATDKGGVCRLALTDLDRQGRELVVGWATDAGCSVRVDQVGNIFARRPGRDGTRAAVATGSHIDTQPTGGKFDGNYGVLAGIEVLRTLNDAGIQTVAPIEVCVWTNEEGSRFVPVMMGSGVYCGAFTLDHALAATDRDGVSVREALAGIGYAGDAPAAITAGAPRFDAYYEAHIEQGPVLEDAGIVIGAVTGALGQRWYDVTITGQESHAGPTPMGLRRDALLAAADIVQAVNRIALAEAPAGRGTVGCLEVHPGSRNVIPGQVRLTVDLRHPDNEGLARMDAALMAALSRIATESSGGVVAEATVVARVEPVAFDAALVEGIRAGAREIDQVSLDIVSGAGHDAVHVAATAPVAMIFVPCKDGISHNEIEDADPAHLAAGANVLLHAMLKRAGVASA